MPSPPKPWERAGAGGDSTATASSSLATTGTSATSALSTPALPDRPSSLGSTSTALQSNAGLANSAYSSPYGAGAGGYGGLGSTYGGLGSTYGGLGSSYGGAYSSPYSRMGSMGGMGGYGGYGGMSGLGGYGGYGGMGMGMGMGGMGMGMGGMGMGMPGQMGDVSLTQRMESGTQATFELISSIVGAFGGFAQMLESTFMATHSSFFAMVGVADQFAHLRNYLGQVLSIFALARYLKNLLLRLTGRAPAIDLDPREFSDFAKGAGAVAGKNGAPGAKARPSKRPLVVFFLAVVGLPYLMGKLVRLITARQEEERLRLEQQGLLPPGSQNMTPQQQQEHVRQQQQLQLQQQQQAGGVAAGQTAGEPLDPSKLTFVRAVFAYSPSDPLELSLKSNDIVAVLSKVDPATGQESQWWKGRTRDGRIGWFPSTYVESLETAKDRAAKLATGGDAAKLADVAPQKALPKPTASSTAR